ncbi:MAG: flagellar basal body L-ring protein FlgH [Bacillota bacterium]
MNFKKMKIFILLVFLVLILSPVIMATSLWSDESQDLYQDYPDYHLGDIITVMIEENASAIQSANSDASQSSDYNAAEGGGILDFIPFFDFSYSDSETADGETQRSGTLQADITTEIVGLQENGNLKIRGNKRVKINGEIQTIVLEGVIRPKDINFDNEISSKRVSNANIEYEGEGVVGDKQNSGLLTKVFNFIF